MWILISSPGLQSPIRKVYNLLLQVPRFLFCSYIRWALSWIIKLPLSSESSFANVAIYYPWTITIVIRPPWPGPFFSKHQLLYHKEPRFLPIICADGHVLLSFGKNQTFCNGRSRYLMPKMESPAMRSSTNQNTFKLVCLSLRTLIEPHRDRNSPSGSAMKSCEVLFPSSPAIGKTGTEGKSAKNRCIDANPMLWRLIISSPYATVSVVVLLKIDTPADRLLTVFQRQAYGRWPRNSGPGLSKGAPEPRPTLDSRAASVHCAKLPLASASQCRCHPISVVEDAQGEIWPETTWVILFGSLEPRVLGDVRVFCDIQQI